MTIVDTHVEKDGRRHSVEILIHVNEHVFHPSLKLQHIQRFCIQIECAGQNAVLLAAVLFVAELELVDRMSFAVAEFLCLNDVTVGETRDAVIHIHGSGQYVPEFVVPHYHTEFKWMVEIHVSNKWIGKPFLRHSSVPSSQELNVTQIYGRVSLHKCFHQ